MFGGNFEPRGWAFCSAQSLPITQNSAPYSHLGTTCGGDGIATFRLPDLRGRVPVHAGPGRGLSPRSPGETFGSMTVTLASRQVPLHVHHPVVADVASSSDRGQGDMPARSQVHSDTNGPAMKPNPPTIPLTEGGQPHDTMQPSLCVT